MNPEGGSIPSREPNDDEIVVKCSPDMYSFDGGETWFEGDIGIPRMPLTYWLNPRHWPGEASCWLAQHDWRKYCHVHDVIHWRWTHRGCCGKQRRAGLEALRRAGLLR